MIRGLAPCVDIPVPYVCVSASALLLALVVLVRWHQELRVVPYLRSMLAPWRCLTLGFALGVVAGAAPYSGDPTWDTADSLLVGVLVYLTAPWSVAQLVRVRRASRLLLVWATAPAMFLVPCWAYDAYILARDGYYPPGWAPNLVLSGLICLCAGLFWSLGVSPSERSRLTFLWASWPALGPTPWRPLLLPMAATALPVLLMVLAFVVTELR
jgi:hypothetical protein